MRPDFQPTVYLLASRQYGTLYLGVTSDLIQRLHQHREGLIPGFTKDYGVARLVWFEQHSTMDTAIAREKATKKWRRQWKIDLIEASNPGWRDLAVDMGFELQSVRAGARSRRQELGSRVRGNDESRES